MDHYVTVICSYSVQHTKTICIFSLHFAEAENTAEKRSAESQDGEAEGKTPNKKVKTDSTEAESSNGTEQTESA